MKIVDLARTIFLLGILFSSCIKEDMSDCEIVPEPVDSRILYFKTVPYKYNFEEIVESVRLYVYDDDGDRLLKTYRDITPDELMGSRYGVILSEWDELPDDNNYHIIGVLNLNEHYQIQNEHSLDKYETHISRNENGEIEEDLNDIFVGYIKLDPLTRAVKQDTILLEKLTNRIYLTIEFCDFELPAGTKVTSYITGSNSEYNYLNNSLCYNTMTYKPYFHGKEHESMFYYEMTTGKLYLEDDLQLVIEIANESGSFVRSNSFSLTKRIARIQDDQGNYLYNTNRKLQEEDEFYLYILVDEGLNIIGFNVNDWFLVNPGVDL